MSISLSANTLALSQGNSTSFQGFGGTPPYVYSIAPGGAGGSINPSTGIYTAPLAYGSDVVVVTDSLSASASLSLMVGDALLLLCNIIEKEMNLANDQVWIWNQKEFVPKDSRIYVNIGVLTCKPFANTNQFNDDGTVTQSVNMQEMISIDILSRGPDARTRKEELILALNSVYAQQQQETNGFYIAKLSTTFVNLSEIDGAAIPYRFNISANLQYFIKKTKVVPYFDDFSEVEITTEP